jgi:hypothetical protein
MATFEKTECGATRRVTFYDSPEMAKRVYEHVLAWFHEHGCYHGESIMQCDAPQLTAAVMLSELADDVINFDVEYVEDVEDTPNTEDISRE